MPMFCKNLKRVDYEDSPKLAIPITSFGSYIPIGTRDAVDNRFICLAPAAQVEERATNIG